MPIPTHHRSLAAIAGLILAGAAAFAASPSAASSAAAPMTARAASPAASPAASIAAAVSPAARPAARPGRAATLAAPRRAAAAATRCDGAVTHTVDASKAPATRPRVCLTVGGIVRFEKLGPAELTVTPDWAADCFYAAGVHMCRLLQARTVTFAWSVDGAGQLLRVRVVDALPSPACESGDQTVSIDAAEQLPWWSTCVHVGATLRFKNLGPDALQVTPRPGAICHYEAGVHSCRTLTAVTLDVIANSGRPTSRSMSVVVIP